MRIPSLLGLVFLFTVVVLLSVSAQTPFEQKAQTFLAKHVKNGLVDYGAIAKNISEVEALYTSIGTMELAGMQDDTRKAFYINAYNLIVIYWVAKHYPLKSPLDDSGFFDQVKHRVAGEVLTLNTLEIKKLLLPFKDARLHFALACAAVSCPPLASFAYTAAKLDQQLNERTALAINNASWLVVKPTAKRVEISKIFEWYGRDFLAEKSTVIDWINQYKKEPIPASYVVNYYEYNWQLNENR
jgi:hypothetical protein